MTLSSDPVRRAGRRAGAVLRTGLRRAAFLLALCGTGSALAAQYDPDRDLSTYTMFEFVRLGPEGAADPALVRTDLDYVRGMREHHAGALSMSAAYLADPEARNPVLRRLAEAIIPNQRFEIALLDEVERQVRRPPVPLGVGGLALQPAATGAMEQRLRFLRTPRPFIAAVWLESAPEITERDVLFAKAMMIHHQGAVEMARAYDGDSDGRNTFLRLLNLEIITDQSQEIALMQAVVDRFGGDADAIIVDPSMVHGMEMSGRGSHHGAGHAPAQGPAGPAGHGGHGKPPEKPHEKPHENH